MNDGMNDLRRLRVVLLGEDTLDRMFTLLLDSDELLFP